MTRQRGEQAEQSMRAGYRKLLAAAGAVVNQARRVSAALKRETSEASAKLSTQLSFYKS